VEQTAARLAVGGGQSEHEYLFRYDSPSSIFADAVTNAAC
jgi:hypothetical protein